MSNLDNLSIRLNYRGGGRAEDRMAADKLKTLKKALLYSYQAETITLEDGREFRCLINPDKLKNDYDNKILSIPFKDICLNSEFLGLPSSLAEEPINVQEGDIITWKKYGSHWIVYLRYLEEDAYFRAEIRRCGATATIDGVDYPVYFRGPVETKIRWNLKNNITWNDLNYSAIAYVKADEHTSKLKRFSIVKIDGQNYEVQVVNRFSAGGTYIVYLKEYYTNTIEEENPVIKEEITSEIKGKQFVKPFDILTYTIDTEGGSWSLSNNTAKILTSSENSVQIEIITGKAGQVDLIYTPMIGDNIVLPLTIESF